MKDVFLTKRMLVATENDYYKVDESYSKKGGGSFEVSLFCSGG